MSCRHVAVGLSRCRASHPMLSALRFMSAVQHVIRHILLRRQKVPHYSSTADRAPSVSVGDVPLPERPEDDLARAPASAKRVWPYTIGGFDGLSRQTRSGDFWIFGAQGGYDYPSTDDGDHVIRYPDSAVRCTFSQHHSYWQTAQMNRSHYHSRCYNWASSRSKIRKISAINRLGIDGAQKRTRTSTPCGTRT